MFTKIKVYLIALIVAVIARVKAAALYVENFVKMIFGHIQVYADTSLTGIHNIYATVLETLRQTVEGPKKFLLIALGVALVTDCVMLGKIGILYFLVGLIGSILGAVTFHIYGTIVLALAVVVTVVIFKEIKSEVKK